MMQAAPNRARGARLKPAPCRPWSRQFPAAETRARGSCTAKPAIRQPPPRPSRLRRRRRQACASRLHRSRTTRGRGRADRAKTEPIAAPGPAPEPSAAENAAPASAAAMPPKTAAPPIPGAVVAELRQGDELRIKFPFGAPTPAAVFSRADSLWLVFDTKRDIDVEALNGDSSQTIRSAALARSGEAQILRIKLERPQLTSLVPDGAGWLLSIGDTRADTDAPADAHAQHRRPDALQRHHSLRRSAPAPPPGRSRHRRQLAGRYGARSRARLSQEPGLRRIPRTRLHPRRRAAAAGRRSQRRTFRRQDIGRPSRPA